MICVHIQLGINTSVHEPYLADHPSRQHGTVRDDKQEGTKNRYLGVVEDNQITGDVEDCGTLVDDYLVVIGNDECIPYGAEDRQ